MSLGAAGIGAIIALPLGLPLMLGYVLAGVAVDSYTPGFVADVASVNQLADLARSANPPLDIVVRKHSIAERDELERRGATEAVVGELELALEMSRHCLLRFGLALERTEAILGRPRTPDSEPPEHFHQGA